MPSQPVWLHLGGDCLVIQTSNSQQKEENIRLVVISTGTAFNNLHSFRTAITKMKMSNTMEYLSLLFQFTQTSNSNSNYKEQHIGYNGIFLQVAHISNVNGHKKSNDQSQHKITGHLIFDPHS